MTDDENDVRKAREFIEILERYEEHVVANATFNRDQATFLKRIADALEEIVEKL